MIAPVTPLQMAAKGGSPADLDGAHGTMLLSRHGRAMQLPVLRAVLPEDVGHFQLWPVHWSCRVQWSRSGNRSSGLEVAQTVLLETCV
jgi:hypothetical protein